MCFVNVPIDEGVRPEGASATSSSKHALEIPPRLSVNFAIPSSDATELVLGVQEGTGGRKLPTTSTGDLYPCLWCGALPDHTTGDSTGKLGVSILPAFCDRVERSVLQFSRAHVPLNEGILRIFSIQVAES